jgi:hypothetical protein
MQTWDESSGSFLPVPERSRGPKGDPGERGPPGKEVNEWCLHSRYFPWRQLYSYQHSFFCSSRAPSAFLENVG